MPAEETTRRPADDGAAIEAAAEPASGPEPAPDAAIDAAAPNERCAHHAGRPAVARCDACGEPVCIGCAVPVRGRVLGPGCVAAELGDPALVAPPDLERRPPWAAIVGAVLALAGTAAPWTRTGTGDRPFGAWVPDVRWSTVAAVAAVGLAILAWWARRRGVPAVVPIAALAAAALVASLGAIASPPTFQTASWGPWVTGIGAALAIVGVVVEVKRGGARTQGV